MINLGTRKTDRKTFHIYGKTEKHTEMKTERKIYRNIKKRENLEQKQEK